MEISCISYSVKCLKNSKRKEAVNIDFHFSKNSFFLIKNLRFLKQLLLVTKAALDVANDNFSPLTNLGIKTLKVKS